MNERCTRSGCGHSPASHDLWGHGGCEADGCRCYQYEAPAAVAARPAGHEGLSLREKIEMVRAGGPDDLDRIADRATVPSSPSSPVPDEVRGELQRALALRGFRPSAELADLVLSLPSLRRLLDTAAAVERVEQELKTWEATATDCDTEAAMHHASGFHHTGNLCRDNAKEIRAYITAVQRALDGPQ